MSLPIEDYAVIGDCHTAALVSRQGSIDWLCLPNFDSPACFAGLLGTPENGHWSICPAEPVRHIRRKYREGTLVLETEFETASGSVLLVDCMTPPDDAPKLLRMVAGIRGQVKMKMELVIRFDYGSVVPWVRRTDDGISAIAGPDRLSLRAPVELRGENLKTLAEFTVSKGEHVPFDLTWYPSHRDEPLPLKVDDAIRQTTDWWLDWSRRCSYHGKWSEAVTRSLITLKALTFLPTGGIVAAPTTSLPEKLGGVRNWDYRFCWVRDASLTLHSLLDAGYHSEAQEWREWLLRAVAGSPSELNILYGLRGERRLTELELPWLQGYENSAPVRTGNAAYRQFQLDIFGEVANTLYECREAGIDLPRNGSEDVARSLLEFLETGWEKPDDGIWEVRGPRRHFVHSKMMAWVAVDRAIKTAERGWIQGDIARWKAWRKSIHEQVCRQGFDPGLNSFVQYYGSQHLDASVLMMPLMGFLPPEDARMIGTVKAIETHLVKDGLVQRYTQDSAVDGMPHGEGVFLACSFWLADNYALQGRHQDAVWLFEQLLEIRNDVGLLSEEYDPAAKRLLGNFPQAFSHVGLVNTAFNLEHGVRTPATGRRPRNSHPK
ncbi:MAG TPA: glycoside hydrolase family 15 protein [Terriglobales bacterium]|nr:glycoside hydrolase family 15 protein [Terriglobales bacterium]